MQEKKCAAFTAAPPCTPGGKYGMIDIGKPCPYEPERKCYTMLDLSQLNPAQRQVVEEWDRNILLIASAGTGKTNTLAYRVAYGIESGRAKPEEILCLTFTNKACREMRERIISRVRENGTRVVVRTFHSFCSDIVRSEAKRHSDLYADYMIFDEEDCKEIISSLYPDYAVHALQSFIDLVKESRPAYGYYSEDAAHDYQQTIARLYTEKEARLREICGTSRHVLDEELYNVLKISGETVVMTYNAALRDAHGLDFNDLLITTYECFKNETIRTTWQNRFTYINIDEVQDTSELEYHILSSIFGHNRILLCGDYFQTVYEWRGSHPKAILASFKANYDPRCIRFNENYRSTRTLLHAAADCLKNLFGPETVTAMYAKDPETPPEQEAGSRITIKSCRNITEEARWIYRRIQEIRHLSGDPAILSKICILTRTNRYNIQLSQQLDFLNRQPADTAPLDFMLVDEFKFFRRQEIKDVLAFAKVSINPHDTISMTRIIKRFAPGIGSAALRAISSETYKKAGIRLTDYLDSSTQNRKDAFALLEQELEKENIVVFDVESTGVDTLTDEIIQIAAIRLDKTGNIKEKFMHLLKLKDKTTVGDSVWIHHFTDEQLQQQGEEPETVLAAFLSFIQGAVLVGHNVSYDIHILKSYLGRLHMAQPQYLTYYDTLDIFRRFHPNLKNHTLEYLGRYFHVTHRSSHDAADDILATAELLWYAVSHDIRPTAAVRRAYTEKYLEKFKPAAAVLQALRQKAAVLRPCDFLFEVIKTTGIVTYYEKKGEENRVENLRSLYRKAKEQDIPGQTPHDALLSLLTYTALSNTELDMLLAKKPKIPIITIHQAKGSEFDYVFLAGMQQGTFPTGFALKTNDLDEEKRLFYVAVTRAKKKLSITWCQQSRNTEHTQSQFLNTLPSIYTDYE